MTKSALGRGLGALLGGSSVAASPVPSSASPTAPLSPPPDNGEMVRRVPLDRVRPCPLQPRRQFPPETLNELADSIRAQGVLQPLIVRTRGQHYELIAGERRWRAAQLLRLTEVPVIVREADDATVLEMALVENLQRESLNPMEEAFGYQGLIDQFHLTQEEAAVKVGISRVAVANSLRLLRLPERVQASLRDGRLSTGHAKAILGLADTEAQQVASDRVIREGLTVRQTEELVAHWSATRAALGSDSSGRRPGTTRDAHIVDLEGRVRERFGTKVLLRYRRGKGALEVRFFSDDELERILQVIGVTVD